MDVIPAPRLPNDELQVLQELIEARKEERKRKRAEGKGRGAAASWDEEEEKVKLEGADSGFGAFENGDAPDHRWWSFLHMYICRSTQSSCIVWIALKVHS